MLVRRRAQALGEQRDSRRRAASARRGASGRPVPSTPTMSPRSRSSSVAIGSSPSTSARAWSWIRPRAVDEVEERHLALAAARGEPAGDAVARRRSPSPGSRPRRGRAAPRRSASTPGKACGNGSMPASRRRSSLARRAASRSETCSSARLIVSSPTSILVILQLAGRAARDLDVTRSRRACGRSAPCRSGDSLESLVLGRVGLGRADDRGLPRVAGLLVLDVDDRRRPRRRRCRESFSSIDRARARSSLLELGDPLLEHAPARSWRRRTRSSRRCRRTRAPP